MENDEISKKEKLLRLIEEKQKAERIVDVDEKKAQVVIFSLAGDLYGCYGKFIKAIVPIDSISPVPGTPGYIMGLTNVRGDIEAVIDLKLILNLPDTPIGAKCRLLIAEIDDIRSGFLVDTVEEVTEIPESQIIVTESSRTVHRLVFAETTYKDKTVVMINFVKLFSEFLKLD